MPNLLLSRLVVAVTLLLFLGTLALSFLWGDGTSAIQEHAREHRLRAARQPMDLFLRDIANEISGVVVSDSQAPVRSAIVQVFREQDLKTHLPGGSPGALWLPPPEASTETSSTGSFAFTGLSYGAKVLVIRHSDFLTQSISDIRLVDGYGVSDLRVSLARRLQPTEYRVTESDGTPVVNEDLSIHWPTLGRGTQTLKVDGSGSVMVSPDISSLPSPKVYCGSPAVEGTINKASQEIVLKRRKPLRLNIAGVESGPVTIATYDPVQPFLTWRTLFRKVHNDIVVLPRTPIGPLHMYINNGSNQAILSIIHDGARTHKTSLQATEHQLIRLDSTGLIPARWTLTYQPGDFRGISLPISDALELARSYHPLSAQLAGLGNAPAFAELTAGARWSLLIESPQTAPFVTHIDYVSGKSTSIPLHPGHRLTILAPRPFMPITITQKGLPIQSGRTTSAGESTAILASKPAVISTHYPSQGESYPRGLTPSSASHELVFRESDIRGKPDGCIFGFVQSTEGNPVPDIRVSLKQPNGRLRHVSTDAHGFYRFTSLSYGAYQVSATFSGYPTLPESLTLTSTARDQQKSWAYNSIELHLPPRDIPHTAVQASLYLSGSHSAYELPIEVGQPLKISNIPFGEHILHVTDSQEKAIASFSVFATDTGVRVKQLP